MTTIWHHGAWNRNAGDWVLHDSIQHHIVDAFGEGARFFPVDSQRTTYATDLVDRLNDEADMLVIGGGGLLFNRPEDNSISGWQFDISLADLDRIRVPIVVYGIGYNRFPYDPHPFPPNFDAHVRAVQERAVAFSVRNAGTRDALVRHGLDPNKIDIVPDAGIFAPSRTMTAPALAGDGPLIGVNIAGDRPAHRWPEPAEANEAEAITTLAEGLARLCDRLGARVLLVPHIVDVDERHDAPVTEIVGRERVIRLPEVAPWLYPPGPATAPFLVGVYGRCDLVVGMRGHACLIPFGQRRRFVAFGSHDKNRFLLEDAGLAGAHVAADGARGRDAAAIEQTLAAVLEDETWSCRAERALGRMQQCFDAFNRRLVETLRQGRRSA